MRHVCDRNLGNYINRSASCAKEPRRSGLVAVLGCALERRRRSWLPERVKILRVERAERGFDRGAEAGYTVAQTVTKKRDPGSRTYTKFWASDSRRAARMHFVIEFGSLLGGHFIEVFCRHLHFQNVPRQQPGFTEVHLTKDQNRTDRALSATFGSLIQSMKAGDAPDRVD
jgi:hypothetical protein